MTGISEVAMNRLDLSLISPNLRDLAMKEFENRHAFGLLVLMPNTDNMAFVVDNRFQLQNAGIYELALTYAYTASRTNNRNISFPLLKSLFNSANREKLLAAGDPLPSGKRFTLYRGVAGRGAARRVKGFSWTRDLEQAIWFAKRFAPAGDPAVFTAEAARSEVYFYTNERQEDEFVFLAKEAKRVRVEALAATILDADDGL